MSTVGDCGWSVAGPGPPAPFGSVGSPPPSGAPANAVDPPLGTDGEPEVEVGTEAEAGGAAEVDVVVELGVDGVGVSGAAVSAPVVGAAPGPSAPDL
ncbi:MAG: hypothetical protein ACXV5S_06775, partial [Acidimicrobiales bacterium]